MSDTDAATQQVDDLDWREKIVAQQTYGLPKERGETYYYSDGIPGRKKMWVTHTPGVATPMRVKKVINPGLVKDRPEAWQEMNIGDEQYAYRLYKALEAYFADARSHPYFLLDTEVSDLE